VTNSDDIYIINKFNAKSGIYYVVYISIDRVLYIISCFNVYVSVIYDNKNIESGR
jgi:hypothetical protein